MHGTWRWICACACVFLRALPVDSDENGYYAISAAGSIFSGRSYGVAVAIFENNENSICEVRLSGPKLNLTSQLELTPQKRVGFVQFELPELSPGAYELTVRSLSGLKFYNTTSLWWSDFKNFLQIQTTKTNYQPGELLQFRVLCYNEQMEPVAPEPTARLWIEDTNGNRIHSYSDYAKLPAKSTKGVYEGELRLGRRPLLGRWRICAQQTPKLVEECSYFQVAEYTAPPFQVWVTSNQSVSLNDNQFSVMVKAQYAYGGTVDGKVILYIDPYTDEYESVGVRPLKLKLSSVLRNGQTHFVVPLSNFENDVREDRQLKLQLTGVVEERGTRERQNGTATVTIHTYPFQFSCIRTQGHCSSLVVGSQRTLGFRISHINPSQKWDPNGVVRLIYTPIPQSRSSHENVRVFEGRLNDNGVVYFQVQLLPTTVQPGIESAMQFSTEIEYKNQRLHLLPTVLKWRTPDHVSTSNEYMSEEQVNSDGSFETSIVHLDNRTDDGKPDKRHHKKLKSGNNIRLNGTLIGHTQKLRFHLGHKFDYASCLILVNGNVLGAFHITPDETEMNYEINLQFTTAMWPFVFIYVYGMEFQTSALSIATKTIAVKRYQEQIYVDAPTVVSPGEPVTLHIKATPNSYVGLLAVEQDTLRMSHDDSNDLTIGHLEMLKYHLRAYAPEITRYVEQPGEQNGLITLTDALYIQSSNPGASGRGRKIRRTRDRQSTRNISPQLSMMPRSSLGDVWFFKSIANTNSPWSNWTTQVPDAITSWQLTAFSINDIYGLTVLQPSIQIRSSKPLFMSTRLPYAIKQGEILKLPLVCFNRLNETLEVTVTLQPDHQKFTMLNYQNMPLGSELPDSHILVVPPADSSVTYFYLRAFDIGTLQLNFTAKANNKLEDTLNRQLQVIEQGMRVFHRVVSYSKLNGSIVNGLLQLDQQDRSQSDVPSSLECYISGNLLAPHLHQLKKQRMPPANGEQQISQLLLYAHLWQLLQADPQLNAQWSDALQQWVNDGYQSLMRLRQSDGGFCYYYKPALSNCSSTWLTAFALRALHKLRSASPLPLNVDVDPELLEQGARFLQNRIHKKGYFLELARTPTRTQLKSLELSIEVLQALLPIRPAQELRATKQYLQARLADIKDKRLRIKASLAIEQTAAKQTNQLVKSAVREWRAPTGGLENNRSSWGHRRILEEAGYLLSQSQPTSQPILNWLISHIYSHDSAMPSYESTVAVIALLDYAQGQGLSAFSDASDELQLKAGGQQKVHKVNAFQTQQVELPPKSKEVRYRMRGQGQIILQCTVSYDLWSTKKRKTRTPTKLDQRYQVKSRLVERLTDDLELLEFCVQRHSTLLADYEGTALNLQLPSGCELTSTTLEELPKILGVGQALATHHNTRLQLELDLELDTKPRCLPVWIRRTIQLNNVQPGTLAVYDINDREQPTVVSFRT